MCVCFIVSTTCKRRKKGAGVGLCNARKAWGEKVLTDHQLGGGAKRKVGLQYSKLQGQKEKCSGG